MDYAHRQEAKKFDDFFTARRYAGATYAVVVCLSVCLSQTGTVPKRLNIGSRKQRHTMAQGKVLIRMSG